VSARDAVKSKQGCATGADATVAGASERDGHLTPGLRRGPDAAGLVAGACEAAGMIAEPASARQRFGRPSLAEI